METVDLKLQTLLKLANSKGADIDLLIKTADQLKRIYSIIPSKPKLSEMCTAEDFNKFPIKLKEYEDLCQEIKINNNQVRVYNNSVDSLIEAFIIEVTSFETVVPEKYKENVLNAAKLRAKNDGNVAMFVYLNEIVGIFNV